MGKTVGLSEKDLVEAFWILYARQGIERITIRQLCEQAGYNRGTFYLHYRDIYDLLEREEQALLDEMSACVAGIARQLDTTDPYTLMESVLGLYEDNAEHLMILLGERGDASFTHRLKEMMKRIPLWRVSKDVDGPYDDGERELLLEQTVSGVLYMIMSWLHDPGDVSAERLLHLIYDTAIRPHPASNA